MTEGELYDRSCFAQTAKVRNGKCLFAKKWEWKFEGQLKVLLYCFLMKVSNILSGFLNNLFLVIQTNEEFDSLSARRFTLTILRMPTYPAV